MPSPEAVVDVAIAAGQDAARALHERGLDPRRSRRLIRALEDGVGSMLAARELAQLAAAGRIRVHPDLADVEGWERYVAEVRQRLQADPLGRPPTPPRYMSRKLLADLQRARHARVGGIRPPREQRTHSTARPRG